MLGDVATYGLIRSIPRACNVALVDVDPVWNARSSEAAVDLRKYHVYSFLKFFFGRGCKKVISLT